MNATLGQWRFAVRLHREGGPIATRAIALLRGGDASRTTTTTTTATAPSIGTPFAADELLEWATRGGVDLGAATPTIDASGVRGLGTTRDVAPGEVLYRVPLTLAFSLSAAFRSDVRDVCRDVAFGETLAVYPAALRRRWALGVFIASERAKGASSFYAPWLRAMPSRYEGSIKQWTPERLATLGSPELRLAARRASTLRRIAWEQRVRGTTSFEDFCWALDTIDSRALVFGGASSSSSSRRRPFGDHPDGFNDDDQLVVVPISI